MRKPNRAILLITAGAAVMAIGLTATTALADAHAAPAAAGPEAGGAGTWSVSPMNSYEGGDSVGPAVLSDSSTGGTINCISWFSQLNYKGGMGLTHTLVTLRLQSFRACTLPGGIAVTVTPVTASWNLTGTAFNPSRNLGVTTGRVRGVSLSFSSSSCSGVLDGTAAGANDGTLTYQYYNNPHWLVVRPWGITTLHAYNVSGCGGIFADGDAVTFHGVLDATYLTITSP
jgi:hypothetical protein